MTLYLSPYPVAKVCEKALGFFFPEEYLSIGAMVTGTKKVPKVSIPSTTTFNIVSLFSFCIRAGEDKEWLHYYKNP